MPRRPRLDIPGVYQHVMARGIDGIKIYRSKKDYQTFLNSLSEILLSIKDAPIMAWALMPNHFHLLIFINKIPLATIMRRLLTKYALYFNKEHKRKGHLFQNRYKSIVCQEDQYLLQLVRYIHLNPLKAKIIRSLKDLDRSNLTGHKALLGQCHHPWQNTKVILKYFSNNPNEYKKFIEKGALTSDDINLDGGGLNKTSQADSQTIELFQPSNKNNPEVFDERVLGRGSFIENALDQLETNPLANRSKIPLKQVISTALKRHRVSREFLMTKNSEAMAIKSEIIKKAVFEQRYTPSDIAKVLGIHCANVSRIAKRIELSKQEESQYRKQRPPTQKSRASLRE